MTLVALIVIWLVGILLSMLVIGYLARRWGHDPFGWLLLATILGPIAIVALLGTRHREQDVAAHAEPTRVTGGRPLVVIACDGSESGVNAARYVAAHHADDEDIVLLAVEGIEAAPRNPAEQAEQDARVEKIVAPARDALRSAGLSAEVAVRHGNVGEQIVAYAQREQAALVVLGRRGAGLTRALLGSVSEHVVKHATTPVTVLP